MSHGMLPASFEMETAVLGAILLEPQAAAPVAFAQLAPPHFYNQDNRTIFETALALFRRNIPPGAVAVMAELSALGYLDAVGGRARLEDLVAAVPSASAVEAHCEVLHGYMLRRQYIADMTEQVQAAYDPKVEIAAVIDKSEAALTRVALAQDKAEVATGADSIRDFLRTGFEQWQDEEGGWHWSRKWGMVCGVKPIDAILRGFRKQSLSFIAADANVGKTMLMLNMANYFAQKGHPVLFYSLEQPRGEIGQRLLAIRSGVKDEDLWADLNKEKRIAPKVMEAVEKSADEIKSLPLYVDDCTNGINIRRFKSETRKLVRKLGIHVVMLDYLQLMDTDGRADRHDLEIAAISKAMKMLSRELDIHVMVASQVNRSGANTRGEPTLKSLKESGALAADPDYVLGLWNPEVGKKDEADAVKQDEAARTINIRILKTRYGPGKGQRADVRMLPGRCKIIPLTKGDFEEVTLEDMPDGEINVDGF